MGREAKRLQAEAGLPVFRWDLHDLSLRLWADLTAYRFHHLTNAVGIKGLGQISPAFG